MYAVGAVARCHRERVAAVVDQDHAFPGTREFFPWERADGEHDIIVTVAIEVVRENGGGARLENHVVAPRPVFHRDRARVDQLGFVVERRRHVARGVMGRDGTRDIDVTSRRDACAQVALRAAPSGEYIAVPRHGRERFAERLAVGDVHFADAVFGAVMVARGGYDGSARRGSLDDLAAGQHDHCDDCPDSQTHPYPLESVAWRVAIIVNRTDRRRSVAKHSAHYRSCAHPRTLENPCRRALG